MSDQGTGDKDRVEGGGLDGTNTTKDDSQFYWATDEHGHKARVRKRPDPAEYPTESLFQKNERVWVVLPGSRGVQGPYKISGVLGNETYRLRDEASGVEEQENFPGAVLRRRL